MDQDSLRRQYFQESSSGYQHLNFNRHHEIHVLGSAVGCQQQTDMFVHQTSFGNTKNKTPVLDCQKTYMAGQHRNPVVALDNTYKTTWFQAQLDKQQDPMPCPKTDRQEVLSVDWHHKSIANWHHSAMAKQCHASILDWYKMKAKKQQALVIVSCADNNAYCLVRERPAKQQTAKADHTRSSLILDRPLCSVADWEQVSTVHEDCHQKPTSHQSSPYIADGHRSLMSYQRHQAMLERRRIAEKAAKGPLVALVNRNPHIVTRDDTTFMYHGHFYVRPRKKWRFLKEGDTRIKVNYEEIDPYW